MAMSLQNVGTGTVTVDQVSQLAVVGSVTRVLVPFTTRLSVRDSSLPSPPVELEKRTQTGVEGLLKCGAVESLPASAEGMNVPLSSSPLAWAVRIC